MRPPCRSPLAGFPLLVLLAPLGLLVGACSAAPAAPGTDAALRSLAVPTESETYDLFFWIDRAAEDGPLWHRASRFCHLHPMAPLPNCDLVRWVELAGTTPGFFEEPPTPTGKED